MRIVSGSLRGRTLTAPQDNRTRPTSDRVRESIFNILEHADHAPTLADARVIDLFAGTGALGLEALSRGASWCLFVESSAPARGVIRTNIETLAQQGRTKIFRRDATSLGPAGNLAGFSFAFLDPPYGKGLAERALKELRDNNWLTPDAFVVVEELAQTDIQLPPGFTQVDRRTYGETQVVFAKVDPETNSPDSDNNKKLTPNPPPERTS